MIPWSSSLSTTATVVRAYMEVLATDQIKSTLNLFSSNSNTCRLPRVWRAMEANETCRRNRPTPTRIPSGSGVNTWQRAKHRVTLGIVRIYRTTAASSQMAIRYKKVRGSSLVRETNRWTSGTFTTGCWAMDQPSEAPVHQIYNWTTRSHTESNSTDKQYRQITARTHRKLSITIMINKKISLVVICTYPTVSTSWARRQACTPAASDPSCPTAYKMRQRYETTEINQWLMRCKHNWSLRRIRISQGFSSLVPRHRMCQRSMVHWWTTKEAATIDSTT